MACALKERLRREEKSMPQSLSCVIVHLIFSTKDRYPFLDAVMAPRVHAYMATVLRDMKSQAFRVGGTADHIHIAGTLPRTVCQSDLVKHVKITSSHWIKEQGVSSFAWQHGYGIFSVSKSHLDSVVQYIDDQEEHHRITTFQEEFRAFLEKYQVAYDERYIWD
jgi:putative transposase